VATLTKHRARKPLIAAGTVYGGGRFAGSPTRKGQAIAYRRPKPSRSTCTMSRIEATVMSYL
jgi:hypothetical protein